ncbi:hypothetical protein [Chthonobacter albigriseus]|uniref:hypothetical protein n=1 Tax=Chthonobacter albigriseus TaxID=1683161 RepID=UPI0015EF4CFB|nr:hypothetical protein [Chthonobacter albigriseus]
MNFFDIVMLICLAAKPGECADHRIQYESYGSLNECLFEAQFYIAQWRQANPQYDVKNWRCEYAQQPDGGEPAEGAEEKKS